MNVVGNFEGVSTDGNSFVGWVVDTNDLNNPLIATITIDSSQYQVTANISRPDVNTWLASQGYSVPSGSSDLHGFSLAIPAQFKDGNSHSVTVFSNGVQIPSFGKYIFTYNSDPIAFWDFSKVVVPPPRSDPHDLISFYLTSKTYNIGDDPWGTPPAVWTYQGTSPIYLRKVVHGVGSAIDVLCDCYVETHRASDGSWISQYWRDRYQNPSGPEGVLYVTDLNPYMILEPNDSIQVYHQSQVIAVLNNQPSRVIDHIITFYANYAP